MGILTSLFGNTNKTNKGDDETQEGIVGIQQPELELSMKDDELLELKSQWEAKYRKYESEIKTRQEKNEKYWKGEHYAKEKDKPVDNLIFESIETFLPQITRKNPEPLVAADQEDDTKMLSKYVRSFLVYLSDVGKLRLKIKKMVRHWAIYLVGCIKVGWSVVENDIVIEVVRPTKLILDPDATINGGEYIGEYIGEVRKEKASALIKRFPKAKKIIEDDIKGKTGTDIQYTEWWTNDYLFWTLKNDVLGKIKNPHFNYETEKPSVDEFGNETMAPVKGNNHFNIPKMPYIFLSVFGLDRHPHDETSLIEQNIDMQDLINKRLNQIDKNADDTNGGLIVSGDHFDKEQASEAGEALRKGKTIFVPSGDVNSAVKREQGTPLPQFIYQSLQDYRGELRNIFGTSGSTPAGIASEDTVRGKIIVREQDLDRSSMIAEYIEQSVDYLYNWMVQMMYVYYDEKHSISILGQEKGIEYLSLINTDFDRKLRISVKEGSMIPTDPLTQRNEAIDLWNAKALDPLTLFDKLEFPNPKETLDRLIMWNTNPVALGSGGQAQTINPIMGGQETVAQATPQLPPI